MTTVRVIIEMVDKLTSGDKYGIEDMIMDALSRTYTIEAVRVTETTED